MPDFTWDMLNPGDDYAAQAIRSIFPIRMGAGSGPLGEAGTVLGSLLGSLSAAMGLVGIIWITYNILAYSMTAAEKGVALDGQNMNSWSIPKVVFGMVMLFPFPLMNGFNSGQALVTQVALSGVGLSVNLALPAIRLMGPRAQVVSQPFVPGVKKTVAALMLNEVCRALVNAAAGNPGLVPAPRPIIGTSRTGYGYVTWSYDLSGGNATAAPVCGTVTVRTQTASAPGAVDMSRVQRDLLEKVLREGIRPSAETVARSMWTTRTAAGLGGLMGTLQSATASYTADLTAAAADAVRRLQAQHRLDAMRRGTVGQDAAIDQLEGGGFTMLGAYYVGLTRLNGSNLSIMSSTPEVNTPSYQGLGRYLSQDLAPLVYAVEQFQSRVLTFVATLDPTDAPSGGSDLFSGATPSQSGGSILTQVVRKLEISEGLLRLFVRALAPASGSGWADPFSALMRLGNDMTTVALLAIGSAAILSSDTLSGAAVAWNLLTFNGTGVVATVVGRSLMQFMGQPIFYGLMALLIPGVILGFVVPMIPVTLWIMGVLGWLIRFIEAVIAVPLWMLAHMTFKGEGMMGRASKGWGNLFVVFIQPSLMVIGMFVSFWAYAWIARLIFLMFSIGASFALSQGWLVANLVGVVALLCLFVLLNMVALILCFRIISLVSVHAPAYIGLDAVERIDSHGAAQDAALVGLAASTREMRSAILTIGKEPGKDEERNGTRQGQPLIADKSVAAATEVTPRAAVERNG